MTDILSLRTPDVLCPRARRYGKGVWQSHFCCWVYIQGEIATVASSLAMTDSQADRHIALLLAVTDSQADHHVALLLASTDCLSLRTPSVLQPRVWRYVKGVWQSRSCCWVYIQGEIATVASSLAMTDSQADRHIALLLASTGCLSLRTSGVLCPRAWRYGKGVWQSRFCCWVYTQGEIATVASLLAMTDSQADRHITLLLAVTDILSLRTPGVCVHELGDTERGCGNLAFAVGYTYKERSPRSQAPSR